MTEFLGRYELLRGVAEGVTAEISLARSHGAAGFTRSCVVKRLLPRFRTDAVAVRQFLDEARLTARLQHRHIAQVLDLGRIDGNHFVVMELVDGPDLGGLMRRGVERDLSLAPEVAAWIVARAAEGLHHAHELRDPLTNEPLTICHGDLSPPNILVSRHGDVKVIGFGAAGAEGALRSGDLAPSRACYLAPESCRGLPWDRRADLFSLGVILHELITARRLFTGRTAATRQRAVLRAPIPAPMASHRTAEDADGSESPMSEDAAAGLDAIVLRALARDPDQRFSDAAQLAHTLERWLLAQPEEVAPERIAGWMREHARDLCPTRPSGRPSGLMPAAQMAAPEAVRGAGEREKTAVLEAIDDEQSDVPQHNLEAPETELVGGDAAVARLEQHLQRGHRLVTVRGAAGIGKSRIALEVALRRVANGGAAWRVALGETETVASACAEVAAALGAALPGAANDEEAIAAVGNTLASLDDALVVLDDLDLLAKQVPALLASWHEFATSLCIVATCRRRLVVPGAHGMIVQPLGVPKGERGAGESDAVRLFIDRARRVRPGWRPDRLARRAMIAIVQRLDGIPLAIELAAARMDELEPAALLELLESGLDALRGEGSKLRKQTLRGAIDWSWRMLEPLEKRALIQSTVFRGGFGLDAARAVIHLPDDFDVNAVLNGLRDKSMLRASRIGGRSGERRYGGFESVRAFALEQSEATVELIAAGERHAEWMLEVGWSHAERALTHDGPQALGWLQRERDNLLLVYRRAVSAPPSAQRCQRLLMVPVVLHPLMIETGPQGQLEGMFVDAVDAMDALPEAEREALDRALEARALALLAELIGNAGRAPEGLVLAERALAAADAADEDDVRALAWFARGVCLRLSDRMHDAVAAATEARNLAQRVGDLALESQTLNLTGGVFYDLGERDTAAECFHACLAAAKQVGHQSQAARATGNLGCIYADRGDGERASAFFHESLLEARKNDNRRGMGVIHSFLGLVAQERGNVGLGRLHFRRGLDLLEQVGDKHRRAYIEGLYAWLLLETGEQDAAETLLVGIVDRFVARLDWRLRAMFLATLAYIRARSGKAKTSRRLLAEAGRLAPAQSDASADGVLAVFSEGVAWHLAGSDAEHSKLKRSIGEALAQVSALRTPDEHHPEGRPALTDISSEVRTALRILLANGVPAPAIKD